MTRSNYLLSLTRQSELIPFDKLRTKILIAGVGAVGSMVSVTLAKMGMINQEVWDFDTVSIENMNSQGFAFSQIGLRKVDALNEIIGFYSESSKVVAHHERFTIDTQAYGDIIVSAVDSMEARCNVYKAACKNNVSWLIDPRMSIEYGMMFVVDLSSSKDREAYEATLYSDAEAEAERCTMKAVMFTSNIISGVVCKTIKDIAVGIAPVSNMIYDIGNNDCIFNSRN